MTTPMTEEQRNNIIKALNKARQEILGSSNLPVVRLELGNEMGKDVIAWSLPDDGRSFDTGAAEKILNNYLAGIARLFGATVTADRKDSRNYLRFWFVEVDTCASRVATNEGKQAITAKGMTAAAVQPQKGCASLSWWSRLFGRSDDGADSRLIKKIAKRIARGKPCHVYFHDLFERHTARQHVGWIRTWKVLVSSPIEVYFFESVDPVEEERFLIVLIGSLEAMVEFERAQHPSDPSHWATTEKAIDKYLASISVDQKRLAQAEDRSGRYGDRWIAYGNVVCDGSKLIPPTPKGVSFLERVAVKLDKKMYRLLPIS